MATVRDNLIGASKAGLSVWKADSELVVSTSLALLYQPRRDARVRLSSHPLPRTLRGLYPFSPRLAIAVRCTWHRVQGGYRECRCLVSRDCRYRLKRRWVHGDLGLDAGALSTGASRQPEDLWGVGSVHQHALLRRARHAGATECREAWFRRQLEQRGGILV